MATKETRTLLVTLSVLLLAGVLAWLRLQPPAPRGNDAPPEVFSAERARVELETVIGPKPHPVGSPANAEVRERLLARLAALGYEPRVYSGFACDLGRCAFVHNIVAELAGSEPAAVALVAHYDSVPASPGAADDGASVAALLEIARALRSAPAPRNTVLLVLTDGEEPGLLGARALVKDAIADRIRVVVNLEARGSSGPSMMFETSGPSAPLAAVLARALARPVTSSLSAAVYERLENDTDLSVFRHRQIAGYNFAFIENLRHYHTPNDDLAHLSLGSVQHQGDNVLALARALAALDLEQLLAGTERAVWTDFLALFVVRWPASWSVPLAGVALVLILLMGALTLRRVGRASLKGWLACMGLPIVAMLLGAVIGMLAVATLTREGRPTSEWGAAGFPARVALWMGAMAPCAMWGWIAARRVDPWVHFAGVWSLWAALAMIAAWRAPYASYLFVLPALAAGLLAVVLRAHRWPPDSVIFLVVTLVPSFVAGCLWFALAHGLDDALGPVGHFAMSASVAMPVIAALPALARFEPRFGYPLGVLAGAVAIPIGIAALMDDFDAEDPQRLNIVHFQHDELSEWWLNATWAPLPPALRDAASASASGPPPLPLKETTAMATAAAPRIHAKAPALDIVSEQHYRGDRQLRVRLRSQRGADVLGLLVPPDARLVAMRVASTPLRAITMQEGRYTGHAVVFIAGAPPDGLDVHLGFASAAPRLVVFDLVHQLPAEGEPLQKARGATGIPSQEGDLSILAATVDLSATRAHR